MDKEFVGKKSLKRLVSRVKEELENNYATKQKVILKHDSNGVYKTDDTMFIADNFDNLVVFKATKDNVSSDVDYLPTESISTIPNDNLLLHLDMDKANIVRSEDDTRYLLKPIGGSLAESVIPEFDQQHASFDMAYDNELGANALQCNVSGSRNYQFMFLKEEAKNILSNPEVTFDFWARFDSATNPLSERLIVITNDSKSDTAKTQLKVEVHKSNDRTSFAVITYTDTAIKQDKMNLAFDKWNHFVISRKILKTSDGWSTVIFSLWINGIHISTVTLVEPEADPETSIIFGGHTGANAPQRFSGKLGPIRIYNKIPSQYYDGWTQIDSIVDRKGYWANYSYIADLYSKTGEIETLLNDHIESGFKLIREPAVTEKTATGVLVDLGGDIEEWYNETIVRINIPASLDLNSIQGSIACSFLTYNDAHDSNMINGNPKTRPTVCGIYYTTTTNRGCIEYTQSNCITLKTDWIEKKYPSHTIYNNISSGQFGEPRSVFSTTNDLRSVIGKRYMNVFSSNSAFTLPIGTKIRIYGR